MICQNVRPAPLSNSVVTRTKIIGLLVGLLLAWSLGITLAAEDRSPLVPVPAEQADFFEKKIRPEISEHCLECHSTERRKMKGGLALDTADAVRKGGDGGPVIVPGNPDESRLIQAIRYKDESLQMPPKERLTTAQVADLETWIRMGAPDPRAESPVLKPQFS